MTPILAENCTINETLRAAGGVQTDSERAKCLEGIGKAGRSDPGKYYIEAKTGQQVLLDGHNRLEVCRQLGIEFLVELVPEVHNQAEAMQWILDYQAARKNITRDQQLARLVLGGHDVGMIGASGDEIDDLRFLQLHSGPELLRVATNCLYLKVAASRVKSAITMADRKANKEPPVILNPPAETVPAVKGKPTKTKVWDKPLPEVRSRVLGSGRREAYAVSLLSDVHAGAIFQENASLHGNAYNPEICRHRLKRYFEGVAWMINVYSERAFTIPGLVLWLGGDLIDGHLHEDQVETSESPILTLSWLEPFLIGQLNQLLADLGDRELRIVCSYGNHGRDTMKPRADLQAEHSHEWGLYQRLGAHFAANPKVKLLADKAADQYVEVYSRTLHFTHGDSGGRFAGGVGGIMVPLKKNVFKWDKRRVAQYHHVGHFHTQLDGGNFLANGSVVGYTPYASKSNFEPEDPQQLFYLLDSKRGKTAVSPIWVCDRDEERKAGL